MSGWAMPDFDARLGDGRRLLSGGLVNQCLFGSLQFADGSAGFLHAHRSDDEADFSPYGHRLRTTGLTGHTRPPG